MKQSAFNMFVSNSIHNDYIHSFLIVFEYLLFVLPSILDGAMKITHYNETKEAFIASSIDIDIVNIFTYLHYNESILFPAIVVGVVFLFLVVYGVIHYTDLFEKSFKWVQCFFSNAYDLFIFRYFSAVVFDSSLMISISLYMKGTLAESIASAIFFIFTVIFTVANYFFIRQCNVLMNISNPQLVSQPQRYPFDKVSKQYDLILFLMKFALSVENNYFIYSDTVTGAIISLNAIIIILSLTLFSWLHIMDTYIYWDYSYLYANIGLNTIRKGISLFNFIITLLSMLFFKKEVNPYYILLFGLLALNMTVIILFLEHYLFNGHKTSNQQLSYEITLFMLISDYNNSSVLNKHSLIQDSCRRKHKSICKAKDDCLLCRDYSQDASNNIRVFYKHLKARKDLQFVFWGEMIRLFYYKLHKTTFKYYQYYHHLIKKYKGTNEEYGKNISMINSIWLKKDDDSNCNFINYLLNVNCLEKKVSQLLGDMHKFVLQDLALKKPETVIELSYNLAEIIASTRNLIDNKQLPINELNQLDINHRNINGALNYSMTILRFILEILSNNPLNAAPLNIDSLEEYLSFHYTSDQVLICSIDLSTIFHEIKILKATGNLIDNEEPLPSSLNDLFPKAIEENGVELFIKQLNAKATNDSFSFSFPMVKSCLIRYIDYKFYLTKIPGSSSLIIYGYYQENEKFKKTVVVDLNSPKMQIVGLCGAFARLLQLKKEWIQMLKGVNLQLYLNAVFSKITTKGHEELECELSYSYYLKTFKSILKELSLISLFKLNEENEKEIESSIQKIKKAEDTLKIRLEKVCEFSKGIFLFNMKLDNTSKESVVKRREQIESIDETLDNFMPFNLNSMTHSGSSVSDDSKLSKTHSQSKQSSNFSLLNIELQKQIKKEKKKLSIFTLSMLGLNIVLIIICIVFLFTQISQTTQLSALCNLFFDFKGIGWAQVNYFLSLATTLCYASSPSADTCVNGYQKYTEEFQQNFSMPTEYNFLEYEYNAFIFKAQYGYKTLYQFNALLYNSQNLNFKDLLNIPMRYYEFVETLGVYSLVMQNLTFQEGMIKYINSLSIITQNSTEEGPYFNVPICFISYSSGVYTLPKAHNLTATQVEVYKIIANTINFFYSFAQGDNSINSSFDKRSTDNFFMTVIFMVSIGALNLVLLVVCKSNINIAYDIFKALIYNIVIETESKENSAKLLHRMSNLIQLTTLYQKNPNSIIKEIESKKKPKPLTAKPTEGKDASVIDLYSAKTSDISFGNGFFYSILLKPIIILVSLFGLFFVIIIVFDVVLVVKYTEVLDFFNYVLITYNSDHTLITIIALTSLTYISNINDVDMTLILSQETSPDGALNEKIKENLVLYHRLLDYTNRNSTAYPSLAQVVDYQYDKLYVSMNDAYAVLISEVVNKDYRIAKDILCKAYQIINLPNFNYLRSDMATRASDLLNKRSQRDYATIYAFTSDNDFYILNTMAIMLFIPMSKANKEDILSPKLKGMFSLYIVLVGIYLAINISLEIALFVAMRWGISNSMMTIQNNLSMLNNCIN